MIVLDASAAVELLLRLPLGRKVITRITNPDIQLHAPHLLVIEVLQVLRRRVAAGSTTPAEATEAVRLIEEFDITYHDHLLLSRRVWELRDNLTAYDASYVTLAELLGATLLTADAELARAPGNNAEVDLIGSGTRR